MFNTLNKKLLIQGIVILLFGITEFLGLMTPVRGIGERLFSPLLGFSTQLIEITLMPYHLVKKNMLGYQYIRDLELKYSQAAAESAELANLRAENAELRALIEKKDSFQSLNNQVIIAPIVSYGQPFIGKGQEDGVNEGNLILLGDTFIGRVGKTSAHQAEVILLQQASSQPVLAKTESGVSGVIVGDGKQLVLKELPTDTEIKTGEKISSEGQPGVPKGMFIGTVKEVQKQANSSMQTAIITQVASFYESHIVEVKE